MTTSYQKTTIDDLARMFGADRAEIELFCNEQLSAFDLEYRVVSESERDQTILSVLKRVHDRELPATGTARQPTWNKGWQENLDEFIASNGDLTSLVPKYFKKNAVARQNDSWVVGRHPDFVFYMVHVYRTWLFKKYFKDVDTVMEFGCGPAHHLACLAQIFPGKNFIGLDWAEPSQRIIEALSSRFAWKISGFHFDFFHPDDKINIPTNSGVFTFGALEQVYNRHEAFLAYLLERKPEVVINVEGLHELYEVDNLTDYLALLYHNRRNYLEKYLTKLLELERQGRLEIIDIQRVKFGNVNDDPLSRVVWRPKD